MIARRTEVSPRGIGRRDGSVCASSQERPATDRLSRDWRARLRRFSAIPACPRPRSRIALRFRNQGRLVQALFGKFLRHLDHARGGERVEHHEERADESR